MVVTASIKPWRQAIALLLLVYSCKLSLHDETKLLPYALLMPSLCITAQFGQVRSAAFSAARPVPHFVQETLKTLHLGQIQELHF